MATSNYKNYLDSIIESYVGKLIKSIAQIDESSENFQIAEKFVKGNLMYHRYLETNKNEIQRNLQGVIEKLIIHSQNEKADRLAFLIQKFLSKPLKQDVADVHYVVLSMLLNLSTNPLESVYYHSKFNTKVDDREYLVTELLHDLNLEDQIKDEWGYSEEESASGEEDLENENRFEKKEKDMIEEKGPRPQFNQKESSLILQKNNGKLEQETAEKNPQDYLTLSMLDRSLLLGTLPMQPYSSFSGLGVFRLPVESVQKETRIPQPQLPDLNLNFKTPKPKEEPYSFLTQRTQTQRSDQQLQKSAKKRNYNQLTDVESLEKSTQATIIQNKFEEDKTFIEKTFLQTHIWKNPNSLFDILKDYYLKPDQKGRQRSEFSGFNHWVFTIKTERALIQDILLTLNGIENESFKINEASQFEKRLPIQLKHTSPESLTQAIEKLVFLANITMSIDSNLKFLSENFNTTVVEGLVECVRDFTKEYKSFIEDVECIFMKQASKVKPKNLGSRHVDLQEYIDKKPITLMELLTIFEPYLKSFQMILETSFHLIETFKNASNDLEQVVRGEKTVASSLELKPFISMVILSYLHRLFSETILDTNQDSTNKLIIRLFFKSWEPYLDMLDKWLKHGTIMDKYSEFFLKYNRDLTVITNFYSKLNWDEDYIFQTYTVKWKLLNDEKTFVCVPSFLAKHADSVSIIGKTIKVLGYLIHQENLYLYLNKLDFKEQFFANLLDRMDDDQINVEAADPIQESSSNISVKKSEDSEKIQIKDYTFGAKLRKENLSLENNKKETKENILFTSLPKKLEAYMTSKELAKFSIKAFTITNPLSSGDSTNDSKSNESPVKSNNKINQESVQGSSIVTSSSSKFYDRILNRKCTESLNNLKIHFDIEMEHLLNSMESEYSLQLTDLLFNHFHFMEYFKIFRIVFFLHREPIYEGFLQEVLLKIRSSLLENHLIRLNQLLKEALGKVNNLKIKNVASLFAVENAPKEEPQYNFSIMNNFNITFKPTYPLDIIFDNEIMKLYNRIFKFILQIKRAKFALTTNNVSIKKPLKLGESNKNKKKELGESITDEMEEEDASPWDKKLTADNSNKIKEINSLKRRFGLGQKELLHFVNNLEFFVGYSVIEEHTKKYEKLLQGSTKITEIRHILKDYLEKIAEICQLHNKKNDMLFELLKSTLNLCWDFYNLYNRFEEKFTFMMGNETSLYKIISELELIMKNFRENNKMIMQILHQYQQKGHKHQIKSLFSNLNFNYFYFSETGDYLK